MNKFFLVTSFLIASLTGISQGFRPSPQGKVQMLSMESKVLNVKRNYSIYLPKGYDENKYKKYPILYLLHGLWDTNKGWPERGHLQDVANQVIDAGEAREMIIVTPDAGTDQNGYFNVPGWSYEKFFFEEFLPYIETTYRVIGDKSNRGIAGLSMGGGGATVYAQKHPELFSSVYAMSALMTIPNGGGPPGQDPKMELLNKSVRESSAIDFVVNADDAAKEKLRSVRWYVDCGDDDFLFDANIAFVIAMKKANIPYQLRVRDGGHTWEYWHSALYSAIKNASIDFNK